MKKIRWGVLGTARINEKILPHIIGSGLGVLHSIASRDSKKGIDYARSWGFSEVLDSYEELVKSPQVDALYISLPNSLHFKWCMAGVLQGKHVLVEKPFALKGKEVQQIAEASKNQHCTKNLIVAEAFMYRHHLQTRGILQLVRDGKLGLIREISCNFGIPLMDQNNIRLADQAGAGSIWDLGCYEVDFILNIFRANSQSTQIKELKASAKWLRPGVDLSFQGGLEFVGGGKAKFRSEFGAVREESMEITGDKGMLRISMPFKPGQQETINFESNSGKEQISFSDLISPYERQIAVFQNCIQNHTEYPGTLSETYETTSLLERLHSEAQ